jgi:hypothetical protein
LWKRVVVTLHHFKSDFSSSPFAPIASSPFERLKLDQQIDQRKKVERNKEPIMICKITRKCQRTRNKLCLVWSFNQQKQSWVPPNLLRQVLQDPPSQPAEGLTALSSKHHNILYTFSCFFESSGPITKTNLLTNHFYLLICSNLAIHEYYKILSKFIHYSSW